MRILPLLSVLSICSAGLLSAIEPVKAKINLLEVIKSGNVEYHVNPKADFHDDPKDIWTFAADGTFHISGRGYGYVATLVGAEQVARRRAARVAAASPATAALARELQSIPPEAPVTASEELAA